METLDKKTQRIHRKCSKWLDDKYNNYTHFPSHKKNSTCYSVKTMDNSNRLFVRYFEWDSIQETDESRIYESKLEAIELLKECAVGVAGSKQDHIYSPIEIEVTPSGNGIFIVTQFYQCCSQVIAQNQYSLIYSLYETFLILRGILWLHTNGIVHGEIATTNALINSDENLVIQKYAAAFLGCDSSKGNETVVDSDHPFYPRVSPFSAPEIIIGSKQLSFAVDIWAAGCAFAQFQLNRNLFPFTESRQGIQQIVQSLGVTREEVAACGIKELEQIADELDYKPHSILQKVFPQPDQANERDLLSKMLAINPNDRPTAVECLQHPAFQDLYDEQETLEVIQVISDEELLEIIRKCFDPSFFHASKDSIMMEFKKLSKIIHKRFLEALTITR